MDLRIPINIGAALAEPLKARQISSAFGWRKVTIARALPQLVRDLSGRLPLPADATASERAGVPQRIRRCERARFL
jgi:imidazoleglycerol phosphate dehydratase HisB